MTPVKLELNVALVPQTDLRVKLVEQSQILGDTADCLVKLDGSDARLAIHPHLTLYQFPLFLSNIEIAVSQLHVTAEASLVKKIQLNANSYSFNTSEGIYYS